MSLDTPYFFILTKTKLTTKKTNLTCFVCKNISYSELLQER